MALRVWLLLMLSLCANVTAARAQSEQIARPLRVLLRVKQPQDAELLTRLRGQTSDLRVTLDSLETAVALGAPTDGARAAFKLCGVQDADALIWAEWSEASEPNVWIALATCSDRRLLARQVTLEAAGSGTATSGVSEACALVLRGALSVLSQGGSIGVQAAPEPNAPRGARTSASGAPVAGVEPSSEHDSVALRTTTTAPVPAPVAAAPAPAESDEPALVQADLPPRPPTEPPTVYGALAVQQAWDGASARGQPALQAQIALGGAVHQLGMTGQVGFPVELRDAFTRVVLARHGLTANWWVNAWRRGAWRLRWSFGAGVAIYQRAVQARSAQAHPRGSSRLSFAPTLGTALELQRKLGPVWLSLGAGVEGMLRTPRFVYQTANGPRDAITLWPLLPRLFLALAWESP